MAARSCNLPTTRPLPNHWFASGGTKEEISRCGAFSSRKRQYEDATDHFSSTQFEKNMVCNYMEDELILPPTYPAKVFRSGLPSTNSREYGHKLEPHGLSRSPCCQKVEVAIILMHLSRQSNAVPSQCSVSGVPQ
ncbi:uncharacterized protein PADG_02521 [Paracoccidioides brasiliensis Pb18]|uniref:Uncharacterized protein n=1 Tax=Paracoccidioides brasiliensis (strain Pb18) TaxID=502780 RepID=C1G5R6_PARBD|nr:uncharacterized protein PADG_02521 [Paracoccidioides brasiliensis Pb18]EEH46423.2 hypothetical protein PADG_02521 [Paracoccidioides brasiliensis Pb18]ODH52584.1 hypothetical protein GX48_01364 [Paracoccidioides brasiliensis]